MALDTSVRPEILDVLGRLRGRIRKYVFFEGLAWVLVVLAAVFWITLGLNYGYFKLSNLELPRWFRIVLIAAAVLTVIGVVAVLLFQRLLKSIRTKALALVLERRFPNLDDRLVTAVELEQSRTGAETPLTEAMLVRTVDNVAHDARELKVSEVFHKSPLRKALALAVVLVGSVVAFGVLNSTALGYWVKAFVGLEEIYWDRDTLLAARVISDPGERVKEFQEEPRRYVYRHPRGSDFTLSVLVPEEHQGKQLIVPDEVQFEYELDEGRGGATISMTKTDDREFRQTVGNLLDGMTFWVRGGDYVNRNEYRVEIVDPPVVDQVILETRYPAYTGLPAENKVVDGSQVSVPMETNFIMAGRANKSLTRLRLETDMVHLSVLRRVIDREGNVVQEPSAKLEILSRDAIPYVELPLIEGFAEQVMPDLNMADLDVRAEMKAALDKFDKRKKELAEKELGEWTDEDRQDDGEIKRQEAELAEFDKKLKMFRLPMVPASDAAALLNPPLISPAAALTNVGGWDNLLQAAGTSRWLSAPISEIPLPASTLMRIYLHDTDDIRSADPSRLTINGIEDKPPLVEANFHGIGEFITPKASIPVGGKILEDYGIVEARFEYKVLSSKGEVLTGPEWRKAEFDKPPASGQKSFVFEAVVDTDEEGNDIIEPYLRFDVSKIVLQDSTGVRGVKPGEQLLLTVYTRDGDNINGPHEVRQRPKPEYLFKVVSRDELLAILYQKNLSLLARFEQIIKEIEIVEKDLFKSGEEADQMKTLKDNGEQEEEGYGVLRSSVSSISKRSVQQINKNHAESREVYYSFEAILQEMANNAIESGAMVKKLQELIIRPLRRINDEDFPNVDRALVKFKDVHENGDDPHEAIEDSIAEVQSMLAAMRLVLNEIRELASYQELANNLKKMIEATEAAKRKAAKEQTDRLFD